jgi:chemotaxis protein methyltransferase CheR
VNRTLSDNSLSRFSELVAARTALHFPQERWSDLDGKASPAAREFGFDDAGAFVDWLASSPMTREQTETLASHLTIGETYFWREPKVFEALGEQILPELIRSREGNDRRLRIWSAGCSTGEEPYSIAIALRRALPELTDWRITILATDINAGAMRKAAAGIYSEWSFRNAPPWLVEGYFRPSATGKRKILPEVRRMVTFEYLNLAEDCYPSPLNNTNAMDVIFCRNVLMYFAPARITQIAQSLHHCMMEGGWLVVGSSELSQQLFPQFASVRFPEAIVYRKGPEVPAPAPPFSFDTPRPGTEDRIPSSILHPPSSVSRPPSPISTTPPAARTERRETETEAPNAGAQSVRALANQGRLADALALCAKTIAAGKLDAGLHYLHAMILQEMSRDGEATASLRRAIYLDPDFVPAHFAMGNLALRLGDRRTGKRSMENVQTLLAERREEDILTEFEGLTVGRFREIVRATLQIGGFA